MARRSAVDRRPMGKIRPLLPKRRNAHTADDRVPTTTKCWRASCGLSAAGLAGVICPRSVPRLRPAGGDCETGRSKMVWLAIWRAFLSELNERQQLKWSESFMDGSLAPAKKGTLFSLSEGPFERGSE